jgi:hypothetical protein
MQIRLLYHLCVNGEGEPAKEDGPYPEIEKAPYERIFNVNAHQHR